MKTTASPDAPPGAGRGRILFFAVLLIGFGLDLWTKDLAFEAVPFGYVHYSQPPNIQVVEDFFYIVRVENPGAMWSLADHLPAWFWILVRGSVFVVLLCFYLLKVRARWWVHVAFGMVLAGACGNVYDNIFTPDGSVRDFLHFVFWGWSFPTFNVADSMISVGACLLLIYFYSADAAPKEGAPT